MPGVVPLRGSKTFSDDRPIYSSRGVFLTRRLEECARWIRPIFLPRLCVFGSIRRTACSIATYRRLPDRVYIRDIEELSNQFAPGSDCVPLRSLVRCWFARTEVAEIGCADFPLVGGTGWSRTITRLLTVARLVEETGSIWELSTHQR